MKARRPRTLFWLLAAAVVLVGGGWYLRAYVHTGNPVFPFFRATFGAGIDEVLDPIKRPWLFAEIAKHFPDVEFLFLGQSHFRGEGAWEIRDAAVADGVAVWFESELGGGFGFSTAPGNDVCPYGQLFLPFRNAVAVAPGDSLRIRIDLHLAGDDYVWAWRAWARSPV